MPVPFRSIAAAVALAGLAAAPSPARAWGGVFFAFPPVVVAPPPVYYPPPPPYYPYPPAYGYAPPAAYTPAPQSREEAQRQASLPYARMCYAGFYTCAAPAGMHVGAVCSCPALGAPSYGTAN